MHHRARPLSLSVLTTLVSILVFRPSASRAAAPSSQPAPAVHLVLGLYPLSPAATHFDEQLKAACAGDPAALRVRPQKDLLADPVPDAACVAGTVANAADFPPPDDRALKHFGRGISDEQRNKLRQCQTVWLLTFRAPAAGAVAMVHRASLLAQRLADANGALVWDDSTRELLSPAAWKTRRVDSWQGDLPDVSNHIAIHMYRPAEASLIREITIGMDKFGLPDVVAEDVPAQAASSCSTLITLTCQTMIEQGAPDLARRPSIHVDLDQIRQNALRDRITRTLGQKATRVADLALGPALRDQGDPENRLLLLTFENVPGDSLQERQVHVISTMFGSSDHVTAAAAGDQELAAASARARAKLPALADRFRAGLPPGTRLLVKAPFRTPDGKQTEYMWVEVVTWAGNDVRGILSSDPDFVKTLRAGATVNVRQDDVYDYYLVHPDGTTEGNETGDILARREGANR